MFSDAEKAYLKSQRLARIAAVSATLQPDVAPVVFEFDGGSSPCCARCGRALTA